MENVQIQTQSDVTIENLISESANSRVYSGYWVNGKQFMRVPVVVKIFNSNFIDHFPGIDLMPIMNFRSRHCVKIHSFTKWQENLVLVMEKVDGLPLGDVFDYFDLEEKHIDEISLQIQNGLQDLRNSNLYHGDLSLNNVLLTTRGKIKLIDYGWPCHGRELFVTPLFMAPELRKGKKPNYLSDLYSLGRVRQVLRSKPSLSGLIKDRRLSHNHPNKRRMIKGESCKAVRKELAEFISQIKEVTGRSAQFETKPLLVESKNSVTLAESNRKSILLNCFIFMVVIGLSIISRGSQKYENQKKNSWSFLTVSSRTWKKIKVNGNDIGYTPIFRYPIPSGSQQVQWEGSKGRGTQVINLRPGFHRILKDQWFK